MSMCPLCRCGFDGSKTPRALGVWACRSAARSPAQQKARADGGVEAGRELREIGVEVAVSAAEHLMRQRHLAARELAQRTRCRVSLVAAIGTFRNGDGTPPTALPNRSTAASATVSSMRKAMRGARGGARSSSAQRNNCNSAARTKADIGKLEPSPSQPAILAACGAPPIS